MTAAVPIVVPPPRVIGPLTRTDIVRYQGAAGDVNPLHHDDDAARAAGFPMPFSVGMCQAGILTNWATDWLGAENIRRVRIRFQEQVWPGDVVTCTGTVTSVTVDDPVDRLELELICTRQSGQVAVRAWTSFEVPTASWLLG